MEKYSTIVNKGDPSKEKYSWDFPEDFILLFFTRQNLQHLLFKLEIILNIDFKIWKPINKTFSTHNSHFTNNN